MHPILSEAKRSFNQAVEHLRKELSAIRTGRANAAVVENINVSAYGNLMPVKGVASIAVPDAKTIVVEPWDKSLIKEIEKGIRDGGVGLNPVNEGTLLRISMPQLTEESRKALIKVVKEKLEECRGTIRRNREEYKGMIVNAEQQNEIAEDERYKLTDELDKQTTEINEDIKKVGEEKEKEVMTI
jgi:ribosome recycling factor